MSHLTPEEILKSGSHSEYRPHDIEVMLMHHGFVLRRGHASHFMYGHPDYPRLNMTLVLGHGECNRTDALKAAHACQAVDRLKTLEAVQPEEALPNWVEGVIKAKFSHFTTEPDGNILRIYCAPNGGTRRSYRIEMIDGKLSILNREYRDDDHAMSLSLKDGADNARAFRAMFDQLDKNVSRHMADIEREYTKRLTDLEQEYGFELVEDAGVLHITHPQYHLEYTIPLHKLHETMADGSLQTLQQAENECSILIDEQPSYLQRLENKGWKCEHRPVSGDVPGAFAFTTPSGEQFSLSTHGAFEVFDLKALQDREQAEDRGEGVEPASSVNGPQHEGCLVLGGVITSHPLSVARRA